MVRNAALNSGVGCYVFTSEPPPVDPVPCCVLCRDMPGSKGLWLSSVVLSAVGDGSVRIDCPCAPCSPVPSCSYGFKVAQGVKTLFLPSPLSNNGRNVRGIAVGSGSKSAVIGAWRRVGDGATTRSRWFALPYPSHRRGMPHAVLLRLLLG